MKATQFANNLKTGGLDFITGVPCSYFTPLILLFDQEPFFTHIPAVREDIAVGLSAGAFLADKLPVIYMQNSGLGYCLEALASLNMIYRIPSLVLLSYRGPDDKNMEEHLIMGKHTLEILNAFGFDYSFLDNHSAKTNLNKIRQTMISKKRPYFLLFQKGDLK
jgi:sulfopyruvate decarboxylase subunit alpha